MASYKPTKNELDQNSYEYDVAFSFLSQDEALATEINDLLQDRLKTFLYSKKQEELAGTDGEETFHTVFGEQSRIVAVLYRSGWGKTSWTRVEETAIRNRAHEHGYDFAIFIPLDEPPIVPKWLPKTRLWVGLKRWGPSGAASVIEARVQEQGGKPHEETVQERAARLERSLIFAKHREQFLHTHEGVSAANQEFESLYMEFQRLVSEIKNSINLDIKREHTHIVILGFNLGLSVMWKYHYANSLDNAELALVVWDSHPPFPGLISCDVPNKLKEIKFTFDLTISDKFVWHQDKNNRDFDTLELASFILKFFMEEGQHRSIRK